MIYNSDDIQKITSCRYPSPLTDRIESIEGNKVVGIKCISANEIQSLGHFPQKAVMSGVLQLEAPAQTVVVILLSKEENRGKIGLFADINKVHLKRQVILRDALKLEAEVTRGCMDIAFVSAVTSVDGEVALATEIMFAVRDPKKQRTMCVAHLSSPTTAAHNGWKYVAFRPYIIRKRDRAMLLGVGYDIVEIARVKRAMEKKSLLRVLSEQERKLFDRIPKERRTGWLAGRFAAKEAIIRAAHKKRSYVLSAVRILMNTAGTPARYIVGLQAEVSISREKEYATVYAAATKEQVFIYILRSLYLLQLIPKSWIDAVLVRKKPFAQRHACMGKWSERLLSHYRVALDVQFQEQLLKDQPTLFVCNHQSEFDMLLQMAILDLPFTFISKKEDEEVPYMATWSKTLEAVLFDRRDRGSAIHTLWGVARRLRAEDNLLIFPEGTRSKGGIMHPMQAGSMQPAFMAKAYIVPIILKNSYDYMDMIKYKRTFHIHILRPLYCKDYKPLKAEDITAQLQEEMQRVLNEA